MASKPWAGLYGRGGGRDLVRANAKLPTSDAAGLIASDALLYEPTSAGGSYTLTAQGGSYTITGQSTILLKTKRIVASGGSYAVTSQSASFLKTKYITASGGAYSITGGVAILERDRNMTAQGGSYVVTGQSATITKFTPVAYVLTAQGGIYSVTGQSASITYTTADNLADTHDGYWTKQWEKAAAQSKRKETLEELEDQLEEIEEQIAEVKSAPIPKRAVYIQSVQVPPIEAQSRLLETLIQQASYIRAEIEEEEEILLLL